MEEPDGKVFRTGRSLSLKTVHDIKKGLEIKEAMWRETASERVHRITRPRHRCCVLVEQSPAAIIGAAAQAINFRLISSPDIGTEEFDRNNLHTFQSIAEHVTIRSAFCPRFLDSSKSQTAGN